MNRLILIGNGFDLAHGLKTDYNSFIVWYLKKCFSQVSPSNSYSDKLISIKASEWLVGDIKLPKINGVSEFVDHYYNTDFSKLLNDQLKFDGWQNTYPNPFKVAVKSEFSTRLILSCSHGNWVDIENEFYGELKKCFYKDGAPYTSAINTLNEALSCIIKNLEEYLSQIKCKKFDFRYSDIFNSEINTADMILSHRDRSVYSLDESQVPNDTLILNFNYTNVASEYLKNHMDIPHLNIPIKINHIHGEINSINNPVIFGFGDELDDHYKKMEDSRANEFFTFIKSFWYFKTSNYHNLRRFIESTFFEIYILGHSCGLSDRTLLNMIFEHPNCKSIKIYYHQTTEKNNYTRLTQEISRHFKNKIALRDKIVPQVMCSVMPQID